MNSMFRDLTCDARLTLLNTALANATSLAGLPSFLVKVQNPYRDGLKAAWHILDLYIQRMSEHLLCAQPKKMTYTLQRWAKMFTLSLGGIQATI